MAEGIPRRVVPMEEKKPLEWWACWIRQIYRRVSVGRDAPIPPFVLPALRAPSAMYLGSTQVLAPLHQAVYATKNKW